MVDIAINENNGEVTVVASSAGQSVFNFDFPIFDEEWLSVWIGDDDPLLLTDDYTVTGVGQAAGGTITLDAAAALAIVIGSELTIQRNTPIERVADYPPAGDFRASTLNEELDTFVMIMQDLERQILAIELGDEVTSAVAAALSAAASALAAAGSAAAAAAVAGSGAFQAQWSAAIPRSNQDKIEDGEAASPFDVIPAGHHNNIIAHTDANEWSNEIETLVAEAITAKYNVKFPLGEFNIAAATTPGISVSGAEHGYIKIYGEGPGSIIKRADNAGVVDFAQLIRLRAQTETTYEVCELVLDANGANTPTPSPDQYDHEHAGTIGFYAGSGNPKAILLHDLWLKDKISADHLFMAILPSEICAVENILATDWDKAKHPVRSCVEFSYIPKNLRLAKILVDKVEAEPQSEAAVITDAQVTFDDVQARHTFDWACPENTAKVRANKVVCNVDKTADGNVYIVGINGVFENSFFHGASELRYNRLTFIDTGFNIRGTLADAAIGEAIRIYHSPNGVDYDYYVCALRPTLSADAGVLTGRYFVGGAATASLEPRIEIIDATVLNELEYTVTANRTGTVKVEGGNPKGSIAAVESSCSVGFHNRTIIGRMEDWTAAAAIDFDWGGGVHEVSITGTQDAEVCDGAAGNSGAGGTAVLQSSRILLVDSDPNARIKGIPGDVARFRSDAQRLWRYSSAFIANQNVWFPEGEHPDFRLTDAATIAINMALSNNLEVTLGGNRTAGVPINGCPNQKGHIRIIQDGAGGRGLTFPSIWLFPGGTDPTPSAGAGAVDVLEYVAIARRMVFTVTVAAPAVFSAVAHGLVAGVGVIFETTGALPTGLTAGAVYYVLATGLTADAFQVSATGAGAGVTTTGTQSGVHQFTPRRANRYHGKLFNAAFA